MKITDNRCGEAEFFEDLECGQVFVGKEGGYWIKIQQMDNFLNAVSLDDGEPTHWDLNEAVYSVEAELIIK